eukprot:1380870-Rhodomonas_salina.2
MPVPSRYKWMSCMKNSQIHANCNSPAGGFVFVPAAAVAATIDKLPHYIAGRRAFRRRSGSGGLCAT